MFYFFISEKVRKNLCEIYGEGILIKHQNWFSKFRSDNFDIKNATFWKTSIE